MRLWKITISALIMASLTGCGALAFFSPRPHPAINYSYQIENGHMEEINQIFTVNGETVIQFKELIKPLPKIFDMQKRELPYTVIGYSCVLKGIHPRFRIVFHRGEVVIRLKSNAVSPTANVKEDQKKDTAPAVVYPKEDGAGHGGKDLIGEHLTQLQTELAQLKAQLKTLMDEEAGREAATLTDVTIHSMKMLRYHFPDGGSTFEPSKAIREKLIEFGKDASKITVTGYTYANRASARYKQLARMRANSARRYLVSIGIPAEKIRTHAIAAGHFIAENVTDAGKHQNRRVEIVFFTEAESN